jgi:hypothetical protein
MDIKIRIGASVDGDIGAIVFEPMVAAAKRARAKVRGETGGVAKDGAEAAKGSAKSQLSEERQLANHRMAMDKQVLAGHIARTRDAIKQETALKVAGEKNATAIHVAEIKARTAAEKTAVRQVASESREAARKVSSDKRALARAERQQERAQAKAEAQAAKDGGARRGALASGMGGAARNFASIARHGVGLAGDIARGAGVQFDIASGVQKRVGLQAMATDIANSGYMEGAEGAAGKRQSAGSIMADIQSVGEKFGLKQDSVGEGLNAFVGKTGDLAAGRSMLESMAKTAKATGSDFNDVAAAAGAISNKIGEVGKGKEFETVEEKAQAINKVLLALAGQGKAGAVELKDLATQAEKLTSQASKFAANKDLMRISGGSANGANIAMLGVLSQSVRKTEKGSAAQATQSAMSFVRDLTSQTAIKRLGGMQFTDKSHTMLRDPQEVIKDILSKSKGDIGKLSFLMPNQNSRAVVNSFADPYMKAYKASTGTEKEKDAAGRAAVDAAMKELKDATLSEASQNEALGEAMATTATKAEQFQQKLDRVVGDMADKLIPDLLKLSGPVVQATTAMSGMVTWAASNPWQATSLAAAGSMAQAGIGEVIKASMQASLSGASGALAGLGTAGIVATAALVAFGAGVLAINAVAEAVERDRMAKEKKLDDASKAGTELFAAEQKKNSHFGQAMVLDADGKVVPQKAGGFAADALPAEFADAEDNERIAIARKKAEEQKKILEKEAAKGEAWSSKSYLGKAGAVVGAGLKDVMSFGEAGASKELVSGMNNAGSAASFTAGIDSLSKMLGGTLKVNVTNMPAGGVPGAVVNPDGRSK